MHTAIGTFSLRKIDFRVSVVSLHDYEVVVEQYGHCDAFQLGLQIPGFRLIVDDEPVALMSLSLAEVAEPLNGFVVLVCSIRACRILPGKEEAFSSLLQCSEALGAARELASKLKDLHKHVSRSFKLAVSDVADVLTNLVDGAVALSSCYKKLDSISQGKALERAKHDWAKGPHLTEIDRVFRRFEKVSQRADQSPHSILYKIYAKRRLAELLRESLFFLRVLDKPKGWDGDIETVNMILKGRAGDGETLYGNTLTQWALLQAPALAHRNRVRKLAHYIDYEIDRVESDVSAVGVSLLSLGCGPAEELFLLKDRVYSKPVIATVVDFDQAAVDQVVKRFESGSWKEKGLSLIAHCIEANEFKNKFLRGSARCLFDIAYCGGLLDYRNDASAARIIRSLVTKLRPNGLVIVTNVTDKNPYTYMMRWVLEWNIRQRSAESLKALVPPDLALQVNSVETEEEFCGVNAFLLVRSAGKSMLKHGGKPWLLANAIGLCQWKVKSPDPARTAAGVP